jgi:sulfate adenylyltransferase subunit 1 (EFTu-like GTPase family)
MLNMSATTDMHTTEEQLEMVFSMWPVQRVYNENQSRRGEQTRVEAGLNTSTVTLRVVGGDEKGSLKTETVKYSR